LVKLSGVFFVMLLSLMQSWISQTYFGVTFDKRMTWKQHITSAEAKARRKMNIVRKLAGTK
jgi:hypothetical protein